MKKLPIILLSTFIFPNVTYATHLYPEKTYQNAWCKTHNGISEYTLDDKTRVDCLTRNYAIEFDFAEKWAESVGQALYYSIKTSKNPGVVLIIENQTKEENYLKRLQTIATKYNIKIWTITPKDTYHKRDSTDLCK